MSSLAACTPDGSERRKQLLENLREMIAKVDDDCNKVAGNAAPCVAPACPCPCPKKQADQPAKRTQQATQPILICCKVNRSQGSVKNNGNNKQQSMMKSNVTQSKSRELRASVLYTGCDCEKRNGLQDDCQRSECHGAPACLTKPPTCGPSEFSNGKHLGKKNYISYRERDAPGVGRFPGDEGGKTAGREEIVCYPIDCCFAVGLPDATTDVCNYAG